MKANSYVRARFEIKAPNLVTAKAITELKAGKGKKASDVKSLMKDLHAKN